MADSVIITSGDPAGNGDAPAFAAGVAAATAEQAEQTAEAAVEIAVEANMAAAAAAETAFDAQAEIAALRADVFAGLDRVVETVAELIDVYTEEVDDGPAPSIVTTAGDVTIEPHKGDPDKDKTGPKGGRRRSDWWWGDRPERRR